MALSKTADQVWTMCEQYIAIAFEHLWFPSPQADTSSSRTFDSNAEGFRIHFLFPSISEPARNSLLELRSLRLASRCLQADDLNERTVGSGHIDEQMQARFAAKRSEFESVLPSLSKVQQEIIREYFF
jgi:hypothetical protein